MPSGGNLARFRAADVELRLLVHPIVVGHGKRLFGADGATVPLQLASAQSLATGVQSVVYVPAAA